MIRSDVGVTACFMLVAETVFGREPSPRGFATFFGSLLADCGVLSFFAISRPLKPGKIEYYTYPIKTQFNFHVHLGPN